MNEKGTHLIKKQLLDLSVSKNAAVFDLQQKASAFCYAAILPALEKVFDGLSIEDNFIQIEKLEINLGRITEKQLSQPEVNIEIYTCIERQIRNVIQELKYNQTVQITSTSAHAARHWLNYMRSGYLSWAVVKTNAKWYNSILEALATDYILISEVRKLLIGDANFLKRVIVDHDEAFLHNLFTILTAKRFEHLEIMISELYTILQQSHAALTKNSLSQKKLCLLVWEKLMWYAASGNWKQPANSEFIETVTQAIVSEDMAMAIPKNILSNIRVTLPAIKKIKRTNATKPLINPVNLIAVLKEPYEASVSTQPADPVNRDNNKIKEGSIYLSHAGLILLHPFLPVFFNQLGWYKNGKFNNENCIQKSILILHYLATGATECKEFELPVAKFICNWPLYKTVQSAELFTADELEEADGLLQVVIQKWDKLKNSSAAAVRENFLQRKGKLVIQNERPTFQIEPDGIDILLDFLPWSLNLIKLPWKKDLIRVEWR